MLSSRLRGVLGASVPFQSVHFAGRNYRVYVREFSFSQQAATLVVLQSLFHQNEFLETLADTFGVVIPMTLLIAGLGGYFLFYLTGVWNVNVYVAILLAGPFAVQRIVDAVIAEDADERIDVGEARHVFEDQRACEQSNAMTGAPDGEIPQHHDLSGSIDKDRKANT